jgi:hypothetical protein
MLYDARFLYLRCTSSWLLVSLDAALRLQYIQVTECIRWGWEAVSEDSIDERMGGCGSTAQHVLNNRDNTLA